MFKTTSQCGFSLSASEAYIDDVRPRSIPRTRPGPSPSRLQRIREQHRDGHRPDAARHRSDMTGHVPDCIEVDVTHQTAVVQSVDADVDDDGAGLDPVTP